MQLLISLSRHAPSLPLVGRKNPVFSLRPNAARPEGQTPTTSDLSRWIVSISRRLEPEKRGLMGSLTGYLLKGRTNLFLR